EITVSHPFYFEQTKTMTAPAGQQVMVDVTLDERPTPAKDPPAVNPAITTGTLALSSTPKGAAIFVDGEKQSVVTPVDLRVPPGPHRITIRGDNAETTFAVDIDVGQRLERRVTLE
ncbi:MAG TPA: PEGA domain-containing protein, partial [Myxococcota bacterium]